MVVSQEESPSLPRKRQPSRVEGGKDVKQTGCSSLALRLHDPSSGLQPKIADYLKRPEYRN